MSDPTPTQRRRRPAVFPVLATFFGTLCAVALGAVFMIGYGSERIAGLREPATACPAPVPVAPSSAARRVRECEQAELVRELLIASGARAANVSITSLDSDRMLGPDVTTVVTVQVFADDQLLREWHAPDIARVIAHTVGTEVRHVTIVDDRLRTVFGGSTWVDPGDRTGPAATPSMRGRAPDRPPIPRR